MIHNFCGKLVIYVRYSGLPYKVFFTCVIPGTYKCFFVSLLNLTWQDFIELFRAIALYLLIFFTIISVFLFLDRIYEHKAVHSALSLLFTMICFLLTGYIWLVNLMIGWCVNYSLLFYKLEFGRVRLTIGHFNHLMSWIVGTIYDSRVFYCF
jgi:hypothetical protein